MSTDITLLIKALLGLVFSYSLITVIQRIFFHPLSSFPGPTLAATTDLYMAYYDINGDWVNQLELLHQYYGSVVRVAPGQLHFSEPRAFEDTYSYNSRFTKEPDFYNATLAPGSLFGSIDVRQAKQQKDTLRPMFSKGAILSLERMVRTKVETFVSALSDPEYLRGTPANIHLGLLATTMEIITTYLFADSPSFTQSPGFNHPTLKSVISVGAIFAYFRNFPFLINVAMKTPVWLMRICSPGYLAWKYMMNDISSLINDYHAMPLPEDTEHAVIFKHLSSGGKDGKIPTKKSLFDAANNLIFAATDTVVGASMVGIFNVFNNKEIHKKLFEELHECWVDLDTPMDLKDLEKLPYLTATIKESLRLSHGVVSPLPRVTHEDTVIGGIPVPANTVISAGQTFVHLNPDTFPDPTVFRPERWLGDNARELEKSLVAFSKGPRRCIGINLAWCEMYLIFSNVFRKIDMELYNMTAADLTFKANLTPKFRKSLQVLVKGKHD